LNIAGEEMEQAGFFKEEQEGIVVREGIPFVLLPLAISAISFFICLFFPGFLLFALSLFMVYFFRNPSRSIPEIEGAAVAPADGRVVEVSVLQDAPYIKGDAIKVGIFMSPFDVHVNRMPISGKVLDILYRKGRFRPAFNKDSSEGNEQNAIIVELEDGRQMALVQVAGVLARRISCWVKIGESLKKGQRFGLIRFGSRLDCYFPIEFEVDTREGQRVWGGETVLGYTR